MRIINNALIAFGLMLAVALPRTARAGGDFEQAKLDAGAHLRDLAVSREVEALLREKESEVAEKRKAGIALIETYLREHQPGPETPEVLFQLAELKWEESKASFLAKMGAYTGAVDACTQAKDRAEKQKQPAPRCAIQSQPRLDLSSSESIYERLINQYPHFRKIDAVRYLYGFSLRSEGRSTEALVQFKAILRDHPQSKFRPDAWMAVAESRFYEDGNYQSALDGYDEVLKFPDSPLYDLALFKTAWCYWKLGDSDKAARRFKEVLDLGSGLAKQGTRADQLTKEGRKRLAELKGEALDYLVQVFTEDESKGPKDAFDFLASIGGATYSRKVIAKLAETFFAQARYSRAIESERFLVGLDPYDESNPDRQKQVVDAFREMDDNKQAVKELRALAETYGPGSDWAKHQQDPKVVAHAHELAANELRDVAKTLHADAQHVEAVQHYVDVNRYGRAAEAYAYYLSKFGDDPDAALVHYLLGDIYFFKLKKCDEAGDSYLAVGMAERPPRPSPAGGKSVEDLRKNALLNAISAYEKVRAERAHGSEILPSDKKMGQAIDRYATLYPKDPEIGNLLLKNGELFYEHGDYDEAVKRFGKIVEEFPSAPVAAAAGDKILESLSKAKDYENVESWARRLLKVPAFQARADQDRLSKLVVDASMKAGEEKAEKDPLGAAAIYVRVAEEFPSSPRAAPALMDAAVTYTRGGKPDEAVKMYGAVVDKYATANEAPNAAWSAGKLYEQAALWDQASRYYQLLADRWPKDAHAADALYNAGLLREHLGDTKSAIVAYGEYSKRYRAREDARQVAFRVGVVLDDSGQKDAAARAFLEFAHSYPSGPQATEALSRAGAAYVAAGEYKKAVEPLARAIALYRKGGADQGPPGPAAHARYLQGELLFHEFERMRLASDPKRLKRTLDEKSLLLDKAKAVYVDAVTFGDPEWATASLFRIGDAYERFSKALRNAPVPKELSADEQQVYRDELEKVVVVVEDKALDAYKGGYQRALSLGVYNDFTQKLRQGLARLDQEEFPPEVEARAGTTPAEPRPDLPFVGSVNR